MSILYRGPSIDTSYQVSVHLAEGFQRRRLKGEKLTDDKWWQKLRLKIKFYLFGIAARPTEKLAAQIILFAFQTIFFYIKKIGIAPNFDHVRRVCFGLYLFQISILKALDVYCIESKRLNDIE